MTDTLNGRVAANIRAELTRRDITQESFAEQAKLGRTTMQALLRGRVGISLDRLELFARLLKVEPSKLLDD